MSTQNSGRIGTLGLFSFAFGNIVGVGWIVAVSSWILEAGPLGAIIAFLIGAVFATVIGLCYAEVSSMFPLPGGEIAYAERIFGKVAGIFAGWILAFLFITVNAFEFVSIGWVWGALAPGLRGPVLYEVLGADVYLGDTVVSVLTLGAIAIINARGGQNSSQFQMITTFFLMLLTLLLGVVGLLFGNVQNAAPLFFHGEDSSYLGGFLAVLATTPFWFAGFTILPQALSERSGAVKPNSLKRLIVASILAAGLFYAVIIFGVATAAPKAAYVDGVLPSADAFAFALNHPVGRLLVLLTGFVGLVTTWNAVFMGASRVIIVLKRKLRAEQSKAGFSSGELLVATLVLVPIIFVYGLLGRGGISPFINSCGFAYCILYIITISVLLVARKRYPDEARPVRLRFGIFWSSLGLLISIGMMYLSAREFTILGSGVALEATILTAWLALGFSIYCLIKWGSSFEK